MGGPHNNLAQNFPTGGHFSQNMSEIGNADTGDILSLAGMQS